MLEKNLVDEKAKGISLVHKKNEELPQIHS